MKKTVKLYMAVLVIVMSYSNSQAQHSAHAITEHFNTIEWYPDSTIKAAYNLKRKKYRGYAIEFDALGNPEWIGKYKNGVKHGRWNKFDSSFRLYKRGEWTLAFRPGCGSGRVKAKREFELLYAKLTEDSKD